MFSCLSRKQRNFQQKKQNQKLLKKEPKIEQAKKVSNHHRILSNISNKPGHKSKFFADESLPEANLDVFKLIDEHKHENVKKQAAQQKLIENKIMFNQQKKSIKQTNPLKQNQCKSSSKIAINKDNQLFQLSECNMVQKQQSKVEPGNSTTSFGIIFQQNQQDLKKQILQAIQQLTKLPSFMPKIVQSSLQGMRKEEESLEISDPSHEQKMEKSVEQKQVNAGLNHEFAKKLVARQYDQALGIFKKMSIVEKNGYDSNGFTPLYLTTLLSITQSGRSLQLLKKLLKDPQVDPFQKTCQGYKPIQQAILFKKIPTLTNIFRACYLHKISQVKKSLKQFVEIFNTFPDLQLQIFMKVNSFVPLVDKITPDDTIKIYKRGQNLRIDYSLVGYSFLQAKRRQMSCIIHKISQDQFTLLAINHQKKTYTDLLQPFSQPELLLLIQDLLCLTVKRTNPLITASALRPEFTIFGNLVRQSNSFGQAIKHELKIIYSSLTQKLKPKSKDVKELDFIKDWERYESQGKDKKQSNKKQKDRKQKEMVLGVWISDGFPLQFSKFLGLAQIIGFVNEGGRIVYQFLSNQDIYKKINGFPVKIQIPMSFSLFLDIKITHIQLKPPEIQFNFTKQFPENSDSKIEKSCNIEVIHLSRFWTKGLCYKIRVFITELIFI